MSDELAISFDGIVAESERSPQNFGATSDGPHRRDRLTHFSEANSMELMLKRTDVNDVRTIGVFLIDGLLHCYTLERPPHDPVHPSIPAGRYSVTCYKSPHWSKDYPDGVPLLRGVPGRSYIEIHPANRVDQLEGCIALGETRLENGVGDSRAAYDPFHEKWLAAVHRGEDVWITIVDQKEATVPDALPANVAS